jgi:hypothetical protein
MSTVYFVYTEGVTYKATNVASITHDEFSVEYTQTVHNESGTIAGLNIRVVDKSDLLYAIVRNTEAGEMTIISGLYDSFDVVPKGESVRRQTNIEAEAARVAMVRADKAPAREEKERAKYEARRAKRKAEYTGTTSIVHEEAGEPESVEEVNVTEQVAVVSVDVVSDNVNTVTFDEIPRVNGEPVTEQTTTSVSGKRKSVNVVEQLKAVGISEEDLATLRTLGILR